MANDLHFIFNDGTEAVTAITPSQHVPEVSTAFDEDLLSKKRGIVIRQKALSYLRSQIVDSDGNPVDLANFNVSLGTGSEYVAEAMGTYDGDLPDLSTTPHLAVRFREGALVTRTTYQVTAAVLSVDEGEFICEIPSQVRDIAGVYLAEVGVIDDADNLCYSNEYYVYNEHSAWGSSTYPIGPPQISDLRLIMRDNDPLENEIIRNYDFSAVEISYAAIRTVNYWNSQPPRLGNYSTLTFPDRELWTMGMQLFLYEMAVEHYRRARLPYNAGGTALDDKNKAPEYGQAWQMQWQRFRQLVMHNKARLNMERGWGSYGTNYGWR